MRIGLGIGINRVRMRPQGGGGGASRPNTGTEIVVIEAFEVEGLDSGDEITTWSDLSGNGNDLTRGNAGTGDATKTRWINDGTGPNGKAFVRWPDPSTQNLFFDLGAGNEISQPDVILWVWRDGNGENSTRYVHSGLSSGELRSFDYVGSSVADWHIRAGNNVRITGTAATDFTSWGLMRERFDGASSEVLWNGVSIGSIGDVGSNVCQGIRLGTRYAQDIASPALEVAAFVWLDSPSAQDVTDWENYLNETYGLS